MQVVKAPLTKDKSAMEVVPLPAVEEELESTTIYVKNLAFATTDAGLQVHSLLTTQVPLWTIVRACRCL